MRHRWKIFVLWVFWVLILWLVASYLDVTPESAFQEKQMTLLPRQRTWPWITFRKFGCPSGTCNGSSCHHTVGEWDWFEVCHEKTTGYLMRTKVLWRLVMNSVSEFGKIWKELLKVIPRPLVRHFDFYCGTCAVLGNSQILQGSGLSNTVHMVLRMNQAPVHGFKADAGNETTGPFICPRNASDQGSWKQLPLLMKLLDLMWTSDALNDKVTEMSADSVWRTLPDLSSFLKLHHYQFFLKFWKMVCFPRGVGDS